MAVAVKDYCELIYGPSVTGKITVVFSGDSQKATDKIAPDVVSEPSSQFVYIFQGATAS